MGILENTKVGNNTGTVFEVVKNMVMEFKVGVNMVMFLLLSRKVLEQEY